MSTRAQLEMLLAANGSNVVFHRDDSTTPCPCRSPEGFRDPLWHTENPDEPMCNEAGFLTGSTVHVTVKAFVQPIQSTRATRLVAEQLQALFGEIQADDHLGIFPIEWDGQVLNFRDWGLSGEDWIEYDGRRFQVVNTNKIPAPDGGDPNHHNEVGLRLISN